MSLNGLDADKVTAAHNAAVVEPAGWFLLHYISRDEVDLLSSGNDGFMEAREAIAKFDEPSPLFGLVMYKKKKALLKYVPEETSRLLQARLSVHVQSVIEKFPHDALIPLSSADDLTETQLSSAVTQLKSSGSVRSNTSRKQRPLTEIPEHNDELPPQVTPPQQEQEETKDSALGPESPPDPLLSPASESFAAARLDNSTLPFATPEVEKGSFVDSLSLTQSPSDRSIEKDRSGSNASLEYAQGTSESLSRSATYETDDSLVLKPKVKVGPRPSLDHERRRPSRGSSFRPVAALPSGLKISTRKASENELPNNARSAARPSVDDMPRIAAFSSAIEPPTSRPGSIISIPSRNSADQPDSPVSSITSTITPEKMRLMKALEKRKKYQQAKKEAEEASTLQDARRGEEGKIINDSEVAEHAATKWNGTEAAQANKVNTPITDELTPTQQHPAILPDAVAGSHEVLISEHTGVLRNNEVILDARNLDEPPSAEVSPLAVEDTWKEAIAADRKGTSEQRGSELEVYNDTASSVGTSARHRVEDFRDSIKEGIFLAGSESPSSGSEAGDAIEDDRSNTEVAASPKIKSQPVSPLPVLAAEPGHALPDELPSDRIDHSSIHDPDIVEGVLFRSSSPDENTIKPQPSNVIEASEATQALDHDAPAQEEPASTTFLHLESNLANAATGPDDATSYGDLKETTSREPTSVAQSSKLGSVVPRSDSAGSSVLNVEAVQAHHQSSDSTSTLKPPPVPEGPTQTIVSNVRITTDSGSKAIEVPQSFPTETQQVPTRASVEPEHLATKSADTKRSSADSKASKRKPPPLSTSKHDSSDLASIDGDLLYEELETAKLEEATSMIVARSPATSYSNDPPRSTARNSAAETTHSPVAAPERRDSSDVMRPKLVHNITPPALSRFGSEQSATMIPPRAGSVSDAGDSVKGRTFALVNNDAAQLTPATSNGNSSPGRKASGVSSLISQRIKAIENAGSGGNSALNDRPSIIASQIVNQRKASLTTPPGSAGGGSPSTNRPFQNSSPSANEFVARTFGSVRVSSSHANRQTNGTLERQSSRESGLGLTHSTSSSKLSGHNSSPNDRSTQKLKTFFGVDPTAEPVSEPIVEPPKKSKKSQSFSSSTSKPSSAGPESRLSISSKKSNSSQKSINTERPRSPGRSESSMSSDGDGEKRRNSRGSRLLHRISGMASPRRNIAEALSDQPIVEGTESKSTSKRTSKGKAQSPTSPASPTGPKWIGRDLGDVNVQFPDNLLWKRRHMEIDSGGNVILAPPSTEKNSKVQIKRYHIGQFAPPYIPDQDRAELPHSIILDLLDSNTLQCSCENAQEQAMVLQVLRSAHAVFVSK